MTQFRLKHLFVLALLAALVLGYFALEGSGLMVYFTDSRPIVAQIRALGMLGPALIVGLMVLAIVFNPLPSAPIALAAGAVYGHTLGTVYIVTGAEIGAIIAFFIARTVGYEIASKHFDKFALHRFGSQNGLMLIVFAARLLPFMSFDLVSYAAGVTPLKAWRFALATLLGLVPMSFLLAHMGSEVIDGGTVDFAATILLLGLLVAVPLIAGRYYHGRSGNSTRADESDD
ncbi:MAG: TVP38/TMEM64 family protein [Gammaproteobacteria bacterium]|nr:TVP38/TMEM64 family protein [Gammaproteobacteria bacterium]MDH3448772.1 TVP38/TMEM64 family protein [Gammaproteobacteria bacterium]